MEVKSTLEVAFEWFCECGAFEQLRKQSKCYSADSTVSHSVVKTEIAANKNKLKSISLRRKCINTCYYFWINSCHG